METIKTEVIIVGAGPTGLCLAAQFLRYGIEFVILDKKEGVTNLSRALAVHARTLEIYDQIGLAQDAIKGGELVKNLALMQDGDVRARLDFSSLGGTLSPFPFLLILEQSKNESLLDAHLQRAGQTVRWQMEMESLTQDDAGVQAVFKAESGQTQTIEARYLVGCDGASSVTRHLLSFGFEGSTYPRLFYVADVEMNFESEPNTIYDSFGPDAFVMLFPMKGKNNWRLVGNLPEYESEIHAHPDQQPEVPYAHIENRVKTLVKAPLDITQVRWFSTYNVHTRHAKTFSKGRCFLAGDAAHVHTPAGGQGMNTGIQDVYNLAWKLALVVRGRAEESLLDTYGEERLANAKRLLRTTDQLFEVVANDHWYAQFFRDRILPGLANFVWRFDAFKEFIFPTISQIGIHYRENSLSQHRGDAKMRVKAGDRMPYFLEENQNIYDLLRAPGFHLLVFSDETEGHDELKAQSEQLYKGWMDVHVLPLDARVQELFGTHGAFMVLLRPDNYIGLLSPEIGVDEVQDYLRGNACFMWG